MSDNTVQQQEEKDFYSLHESGENLQMTKTAINDGNSEAMMSSSEVFALFRNFQGKTDKILKMIAELNSKLENCPPQASVVSKVLRETILEYRTKCESRDQASQRAQSKEHCDKQYQQLEITDAGKPERTETVFFADEKIDEIKYVNQEITTCITKLQQYDQSEDHIRDKQGDQGKKTANKGSLFSRFTCFKPQIRE